MTILEASLKQAHILMFLTLLLPASFLGAQEFTGRVSDSTGAVLPKATVTAHNLDTGVDIPAISTATGDYTIPYLKPGQYTLSAQANGFEKGVRTGIVLEVGQTATVNFALKVGSASETVTVNADALLNMRADLGEVVENTRVTELPLVARDPNMLSILNAGVLWTGSIIYQRPFDDTMGNLSVNGGGAGNNELMLDGTSNAASSVNGSGNSKIAYVPPVDSVQEFKIITNPYDAQFGRASGGVIDMTLKSGTNKLHGDVYEYARRTWLDANQWQNDYYLSLLPKDATNRSQYASPQHKQDQYGAELDGPIRIPKLYNGRDRSFFLLQYENYNEIQPALITGSLPDPSWQTGDFSDLTYWTGSAYAPIIIYDPLTLHDDGSGNLVRDPFPGNIIPQGRLNPVVQKIMSYYPKPNVTPQSGTNPFANNYVVPNPNRDHYRNVIGKWDENLTSSDRFSLRYGYWERTEYHYDSDNGLPGVMATGAYPHGERAHTFALDEIHTFSPNLIFDFRTIVSVRADFSNTQPGGFDPTTLGWSSSFVSQLGPSAGTVFPQIYPSEFQYIGNSGNPGNSQEVSNSLGLFPSLTWVKGQHTIHAGLDARFMQYVYDKVGGDVHFWVDRMWTQSNYIDSLWTSDSGNSFASLLLGTADGTGGSGVSLNSTHFFSQHYWAPFVQDDWKVTSKLTLNLGLRYDLNPGETERNNAANYAFNTTVINPVDAQVNHSLLPNNGTLYGGVTYLGNGNPRSNYALVKTNIQPRIGFAYALDSNTVLRGGIGEMFKNPQTGPTSYGSNASTAYNESLDGDKTPNPAANLSNPFPTVIQPFGSSRGLATWVGNGVSFINPRYKIPSFWNFSLGVERTFLKKDVVDVSYVGTRLYNGDTSDDINHQNTGAIARCNLDLGGNPNVCNSNAGAYVPNPFYGLSAFAGSGISPTATTIQSLQLTRPYPQYQGITESQLNDGHSWYNSLQVTALHKWSNSLTLHGSWTWSKLMESGGFADTVYRLPSRTLDGNDHTHRITLSGVYLLPVGRGRTFLGHANRLVDGAIGGWELGSYYIYESGVPWGVSGFHYLHSAYLPRHSLSNGYIRGVAPCVEQWQSVSGGGYQLKSPAAYTYSGTCSQANFEAIPQYGATPSIEYTGIRVPGAPQLNTSLSKNFAIVENMKLQFRLDSYNTANHPTWNEGYSSNVYDPWFGTIEKGPWAPSNIARQTQLSLKLSW